MAASHKVVKALLYPLQHPLLASALARIAEDSENRAYIGRDEGAIRQLLSMVLSDDTHVVQQACKALSSIAMDTTLVARLVKADVLQSIWAVLGSKDPEIQVGDLKRNCRFGGLEVFGLWARREEGLGLMGEGGSGRS